MARWDEQGGRRGRRRRMRDEEREWMGPDDYDRLGGMDRYTHEMEPGHLGMRGPEWARERPYWPEPHGYDRYPGEDEERELRMRERERERRTGEREFHTGDRERWERDEMERNRWQRERARQHDQWRDDHPYAPDRFGRSWDRGSPEAMHRYERTHYGHGGIRSEDRYGHGLHPLSDRRPDNRIEGPDPYEGAEDYAPTRPPPWHDEAEARELEGARWDRERPRPPRRRGPRQLEDPRFRGDQLDYGYAERGSGETGRDFAYDLDAGRITFGHGPHTGMPPRDWIRANDRIREDICERMTHHGHLDPSHIEIEVERGEVTLRGTVADRRQKRLAEMIADHVDGVHDVHNRLTLQREAERRQTREPGQTPEAGGGG